MRADPEILIQFVFKKPSLRRIWICTALDIGVVAIAILVRVKRVDFGFLFPEAFHSFPKLPWVLSGLGFVAFLISLVLKWKRQGRQAMKDHFVKHLFESLLPALAAIILYFLWNVMYLVPHQIWREAAFIKPPPSPIPIPSARPQGGTDQAHQRRKASHASAPKSGEAPGGDSDVFQAERPFMVIITGTLNPPVIPLNSVTKHAGFQIGVENRGRHFAQHTALSARMIFPNRYGINIKGEVEAECEHPSSFMDKQGTSIGPGEQKHLNATADTDFDGLTKQLRDPVAVSLWGFMVGCVIYQSELTKRTLHTGFAFSITSPLKMPELRDLLDRGLQNGSNQLVGDKVFFSLQAEAYDD